MLKYPIFQKKEANFRFVSIAAHNQQFLPWKINLTRCPFNDIIPGKALIYIL